MSFQNWQNGTVVNVIFPNCDPNYTSDLISFVGNENSSGTRRRFYELTNTDGQFHYLTMWQISTELDVKIQEIMVPTGLAYLTKVGTMDEFTGPIKYYEATNNRTDYKSTNWYSMMVKIIEVDTGDFVRLDDIHAVENGHKDVRGITHYLKDSERYVKENVFDFYSESDE